MTMQNQLQLAALPQKEQLPRSGEPRYGVSVVPIKRKLIDHVKNFSLRFMDDGHQWQTQWPVQTPGASPLDQLRFRPVAVEVTIEFEGIGIVMRHIEIAG